MIVEDVHNLGAKVRDLAFFSMHKSQLEPLRQGDIITAFNARVTCLVQNQQR